MAIATNWNDVVDGIVNRLETNLSLHVNQDGLLTMPQYYPYLILNSDSTSEDVANRKLGRKYLTQCNFTIFYIHKVSPKLCLASKARDLMEDIITGFETSSRIGVGFNLRRTGRSFSIDKSDGIILIEINYEIYFAESLPVDYTYM